MEITGKFKDALTRQNNEGVRIFNRPGSFDMFKAYDHVMLDYLVRVCLALARQK